MKTYSPTAFQRIVLLASGLIAGVIAWRGVVEPVVFLESFRILVVDAAGRNEIIGQYGGFFAAISIFMVAAAFGWVRTSSALVVLVCLYGGVLAGRLIALSQDGWTVFVSYPRLLQIAHGIDAVGLLASVTALKMRHDYPAGTCTPSGRCQDP